MRKHIKENLINLVVDLESAHEEILGAIQSENLSQAQNMLGECQEFAISIGDIIEESEGEGFPIIHELEIYCEKLFEVYSAIDQDRNAIDAFAGVKEQLSIIKESIKTEIPLRYEVVFFPYKAAMWDSLESIYLAAKEDPNVDAYCVPIPYYDRNPDGSMGTMHYEGKQFPEEIEITDWQQYDHWRRKPDAVYIHNPYDQQNLVTSIHPLYYSERLKKSTNCLVYVPYFSTAGGMSEGQRSCPAYYNADFIVVQAHKYIKFYDEQLPTEKFLCYGSPKFDRVINKCANLPEPPAGWKEKMSGKKVYFYNTSLGMMLNDTVSFFKKMQYVFDTFKANPQACLIWRPHPLFESTIRSMRPMFLEMFLDIRDGFIKDNYGIYDDTNDITNTIALSDVYVGDEGTSVTSLFGIAGKPLFSLNTLIHTLPKENDWKGDYLSFARFTPFSDDKWMIMSGNRLFISENNNCDYNYRFAKKLHEGQDGFYYGSVREINGKKYICPINAQNILVTSNGQEFKTIELKRQTEGTGVFLYPLVYKNKLVLVPHGYGSVVIYDTTTQKTTYYDEYADIHVRNTQYGKRVGTALIYKKWLFIISPEDDIVRAQNLETNKIELLRLTDDDQSGTIATAVDGDYIWMLPHHGSTVRRWNPIKGTIDRYEVFPNEIVCVDPLTNIPMDENAFGSLMITDDYVYVCGLWSDISARINKKTGEITKWNIDIPVNQVSDYYYPAKGFIALYKNEYGYRILSNTDRKIYDFKPDTGEYRNIPIELDYDECRRLEPGFSIGSNWMQYKCSENAWNTLDDLLKDNITGNQFDRQAQIDAFRSINASPEGDCGEKVHTHIIQLVRERI